MAKRVSFKVAKALKDAGYPQYGSCDEYYNQKGQVVSKFCVINKLIYPAPTYLEVWLWLQSTRRVLFGVPLESTDDNDNPTYSNQLDDKLYTSPEEAIIAAIEYICDNDLIK